MVGSVKRKLRIGIDLGGSKFRAGFVTPEAEIVGKTIRKSLEGISSGDDLVSLIDETIQELFESESVSADEIAGIGIGSPGPLDIHTGTILETPNMLFMNGYPLGPSLEAKVSIPVYIANDANVFVLGEQKAGAAKGCDTVFGVTLGTGFGCGIVIGGKLHEGATGTAAEYSNSEYRDTTFEEYVSGRGIKAIYKRLTGKAARPIEIEAAAKLGEVEALEAWEEFGMHLGNALTYVVNLLDPDVIVIGGSISNAFDLFVEGVKKSIRAKCFKKPAENLRLLKAEKGEEAAIIGAALCIDSRK